MQHITPYWSAIGYRWPLPALAGEAIAHMPAHRQTWRFPVNTTTR